MNLIDFTKNGGYRFKQFTLRKMQEAYMQILKMFVDYCNVPETGNFIISGMRISGANITAGYCYIDGELCRFEQTAGTATALIKKNVVIQALGFKNGNNENVFRFVNAQVDGAEGTALSAFTRVSPVFDNNYVHTDNNLTNALVAKLNGIEPGAEVNVQTDWDVVNPLSDAYLKNKPVGLLKALYNGTFMGIPDIDSDGNLLTVNFPNVGTSNYIIVPSLVSNAGSDWQGDVNVTFVFKNKTNTSFDFAVYEVFGSSQNMQLDFLLIQKP